MHGLFRAARDAMAKSHSPYSDFPVGAAILTANGKVYTGANMEVISFPEGWCAETSALAHYVMGGRGTIVGTENRLVAGGFIDILFCHKPAIPMGTQQDTFILIRVNGCNDVRSGDSSPGVQFCRESLLYYIQPETG